MTHCLAYSSFPFFFTHLPISQIFWGEADKFQVLSSQKALYHKAFFIAPSFEVFPDFVLVMIFKLYS